MTNKVKGNILKGTAIVIDVGVPLVATISQFPLWVDTSAEATMSGLFLILAFLSCIPFLKQLKAYFKSPAAWVMWLVLLVLFLALRNIINEMVIVCFFGTIANAVGTFIYKIGKIVGDRP